MSETDLLSAIMKALAVEPGVVAWRNNTGMHGRVRYGLGKGSADIIACVGPRGRFVGLEVKDGKGRVTEDQELWWKDVADHGGVYRIVRSVDEARRAVQDARR